MKADRNKTIDMSVEEGGEYLERCITISGKVALDYIGIEQNEQYCVWAEKRLEMADSDTTIQGYADGVFWERNSNALQQKYRNNTDILRK